VDLHINAQSDELDAFLLEAHALFESGFAVQENLPICADDALPRNSARAVECPGDLAGGAGKSGGVGDVSVSGDLAAGYATYLREHLLEHIRQRLGHANDCKTRLKRV